MIFAIEGADRAGKTTLFKAIRQQFFGATFVPSIPMERRLLPVIDLVEQRTVALWEALYRPDLLYVADRVPFVSNVAYAKIFDRPPVEYPKWTAELFVFYIRSTSGTLRIRANEDAFHKDFTKTVAAFDETIIGKLTNSTVDAETPLKDQLHLALFHLRELRRELFKGVQRPW